MKRYLAVKLAHEFDSFGPRGDEMLRAG